LANKLDVILDTALEIPALGIFSKND
jgi:hypothetical protein